MPTTVESHLSTNSTSWAWFWFDKRLNSYQHLGCSTTFEAGKLRMPLSLGWQKGIPKVTQNFSRWNPGATRIRSSREKNPGIPLPLQNFFRKYGNSKPYGKGASWLGMCFFWRKSITSQVIPWFWNMLFFSRVFSSRSSCNLTLPFPPWEVSAPSWNTPQAPGIVTTSLKKNSQFHHIKRTKITQIRRLKISFSVYRFFQKVFWNKKHDTWDSPFYFDSLEDNL